MLAFVVSLLLRLSLVCARWSESQALEWYQSYGWSAGVNYIPAYAVNQIQMWQDLDLDVVGRQLWWAKRLGFSKLRVFLHIEPYRRNSSRFLKNVFEFLAVAKSRGQHVILVLFDDCWKAAWTGEKQPDPIPGLHNSQWVQCPGKVALPQDALKNYVTEVIGTFKNSDTVVLWDLYNEAGNSEKFEESLPLCKKVFQWARQVNPSQPLTSGWWDDSSRLQTINSFILQESDVVSFHAYCDLQCTLAILQRMKETNRPVVCTEYMARALGSHFGSHLPMFKREGVWGVSWGLVFGRTQTYYPWWSKEGQLVPNQWFCDVLREDGTPFSKAEAELIRQITEHEEDNLASG